MGVCGIDGSRDDASVSGSVGDFCFLELDREGKRAVAGASVSFSTFDEEIEENGDSVRVDDLDDVAWD